MKCGIEISKMYWWNNILFHFFLKAFALEAGSGRFEYHQVRSDVAVYLAASKLKNAYRMPACLVPGILRIDSGGTIPMEGVS